MRDSTRDRKAEEAPSREDKRPVEAELYDPWEEEFRKSYRKDDMAFEF
ncbi:hypothetical protein QD460_17825 [Rhizobium jaguaris]|nr:hypothetical protein [Rhizobium jaguaris]